MREEPLRRLAATTASLSQRYDVIYVHVQLEQTDPVERLCIMERLDQLVLKPLSDGIGTREDLRFLVAIDDRDRGVPFVAVGAGLPRHPIAKLQEEQFAQSPLQYDDSAELFAWLTRTSAAALPSTK